MWVLLAARNAAGGIPKNAMTGAIAEPEDDNDRHQDRTPAAHGVKFARLSGGHLTPVTLWGDIARMIPGGGISLLSSLYDFILGQIDGGQQRGTTSGELHQIVERAMIMKWIILLLQ